MAPDLWAVGAPVAPETGRSTAPTIATTAAKLPIRDVLLIRPPPCVGFPDCRATLPAAFRPIAGPRCPRSSSRARLRPAPPPSGRRELREERRQLAEFLAAA